MWISGPVTKCGIGECRSLTPPRVTREIWDAQSEVVVGQAKCNACGAGFLFTRRLTKAEASVAQEHHQPPVRAAARGAQAVSNRTHLFALTPVRETDPGNGLEALEFLRDDDTKTYRVFVNTGGSCVDLTIEELRAFSEALARAVVKHEPWWEDED